MTHFRKMNDSDDINLVANGIYSTDMKLFNLLFKNSDRAVKAIELLIDSKYVNPFHRDFVTVVCDDNDHMEGFIVSYFSGDISLEYTVYALLDTGFTNLSKILLNELMVLFFASGIHGYDYYIGNLYVFMKYRKNGLGSKLVEKVKQKARVHNARFVRLDVNYSERHLLKFYENLGFTMDKDNCYSFLGKIYGCYGLVYEIR